MALTPGTRLGPYEILRAVGAGGMGEVYKARDTRLSRDVAVKVLPAARSGARDAEARFEREARAIAAVNHPNICAIYDVGNHEGQSYLVMELLEGEPLNVRLTRGPLDVATLVDHAIALADALETAHARGLLHRDLKPANVFVTNRGHVKILDFGLAKAVDTGHDATRATVEALTDAGATVGTLGYMAPEQLRGEAVDARADVFALGAVLYEMASGRRAFPGTTAALVTDAILHHTPTPLHTLRPDLPPKLDETIAATLEKPRDARCPSAGDLRANLTRIKRLMTPASTPLAAAPSATPPAVSSPTLPTALPASAGSDAAVAAALVRRHPLTMAAVALVVVTALGGAAWWVRAPTVTPATAPAAPALVGPATNTIAVLPFADMSEQKDQEYFSDGLAEELLNQLTKSPDLQVTARTSSFSFKGQPDDVRTIAKKLNVAHVLEGSVRKAGNRLRITTQLIRADTGVQLWSETYDRELKDVFRVQDEIASTVASALKLKLAPAGSASVAHRTANMDAYAEFLIGRREYDGGTLGGVQRAAAAFRRAIALDPNYAAAQAELAMSIYTQAQAAIDTKAFAEALALAERAAALSPEASTLGVRGYLRFVVAWDWAGALADFERAVALAPGDAVIQRRYSTCLTGVGRRADSLVAAKKAFDLDPLSEQALSLYGLALAAIGRPEEAHAILARPRATPGVTLNARLAYLAGVKMTLGRFQEALTTYQQVENVPGRLWGVAVAEHSLGHETLSQQALAELVARHGKTNPFAIGGIFAWRGDLDHAFEWLERAREARDTNIPRSLLSSGLLEPIRRDPRYAALLASLKLPA